MVTLLELAERELARRSIAAPAKDAQTGTLGRLREHGHQLDTRSLVVFVHGQEYEVISALERTLVVADRDGYRHVVALRDAVVDPDHVHWLDIDENARRVAASRLRGRRRSHEPV